MSDEAFEAWVAGRKAATERPAPSSSEAAALVARASTARGGAPLRWWSGLRVAGAVLAAMVIAWVVWGRSGPSAPEVEAPVVLVPEPVPFVARTLGPGRHDIGDDVVQVGESSEVEVAEPDRMRLARGRVSIEAAPRHEGRSLQIDAGSIQVRVVGTRFEVVREPASVNVFEGVVVVLHEGRDITLRAGERFVAEPPALPSVAELRRVARADPAAARDGLLAHLERHADDAEAWQVLAQVQHRAGDADAALDAWSAVERLGPARRSQHARFQSAVLLEDEPSRAIPFLQTYLEADPPGPLAPEARLRLGRAQLSLDDPRGFDTLRQLITLHPASVAADRARTLLDASPGDER